MQILCETTSPPSIAEGWQHVLQACNHTCKLFDSSKEPAFDVFGKLNPNIFIQTKLPTRAVEKCVRERIPSGMLTTGLLGPFPAADTVVFDHSCVVYSLECDFAYVGDYNDETHSLIDKYVLPLTKVGKLKVFGDGPWPIPQYLGKVRREETKYIYRSAKYTICLSNNIVQNEQQYYDILMAGGVCLTNCKRSTHVLDIDDEASHDTEWFADYRRYSRKLLLQDGLTYWNSVDDIFRNVLNLDEEADKVLEKFHEIFPIR